jgi:4-hydroxybenzoate polyprenyltransferase
MFGALVASLRPRQWTKNLLVFAGLIFSRGLHEPALVARSGLAFALFCLLSGGVYLINDVVDAGATARTRRSGTAPSPRAACPRGSRWWRGSAS